MEEFVNEILKKISEYYFEKLPPKWRVGCIVMLVVVVVGGILIAVHTQ